MQEIGLADIVFILCITAGLIGIYINRPTKKGWDDGVLDKVYGNGAVNNGGDHPFPK